MACVTQLLVPPPDPRLDGLDADLEDLLGDARADLFEHGIEDLEALEFVLQKRVLLAVGAQVHRLAQRLEAFQMVLPAGVDLAQILEADKQIEALLSDLGGLLVEILLEILEDPLFQLRRTEGVHTGRFFPWRVPKGLLEAPQEQVQADAVLARLLTIVLEKRIHGVFGRGQKAASEVCVRQDLVALGIDELALFVQDIVVFQKVLADLEVSLLDALLSPFDRLVDPGVIDRLPVLHSHSPHQPLEVLSAEEPHQVVVQGDVEARGTRVALPARTPAELIVDAPRIVPFGPEHVKTSCRPDFLVVVAPILQLLGQIPLVRLSFRLSAGFLGGPVLGIPAELDIGAASRHVGGDGNGPRGPGFGDDQGFPGVVLGVEHLVTDACTGEQS